MKYVFRNQNKKLTPIHSFSDNTLRLTSKNCSQNEILPKQIKQQHHHHQSLQRKNLILFYSLFQPSVYKKEYNYSFNFATFKNKTNRCLLNNFGFRSTNSKTNTGCFFIFRVYDYDFLCQRLSKPTIHHKTYIFDLLKQKFHFFAIPQNLSP